MSNHIEIHETTFQYVEPFPGRADDAPVFIECVRCMGVGYIAGMEHVENAVCFGCRGQKGTTITAAEARLKEKRRIANLKGEQTKLLKKQRFHNEQMEKAEAEFPILAGWFEAIATNNFLLDLWTKAFDYELSEKQVAAAARVLQSDADYKARKEAEKAAAAPAPSGKVQVIGEVVSARWQESAYGSTAKMVVKHESGYKVWATIPQKLWDTLEEQLGLTGTNVHASIEDFVGKTVSFTATLEVSDDDASFAFAKRPTQATFTK